jgi:enterochelin esterase-like enzyme
MDWLARAKREGTPLIDGNTATFVWQGESFPYLHLEIDQFQARRMKRVGKKNLWIHQVEIVPDAYVEYFYSPNKRDSSELMKDPFNKRLFPTGLGHSNHYFGMSAYQPNPLIERPADIARGTVSKHLIKNLWMLPEPTRTVWFYKPATDEAVPLLLVWDGNDYLDRGKLTEIVDNLIAQKKIRPIALAMLSNFNATRFLEYNQSDTTLAFFGQHVLPLAQKKLNLLDYKKHTGSWGVMGASMGGLMSLYTGLRLPNIFGKVLSQAGAYWQRGIFSGEDMLIKQMIQHLPKAELKIWQDVGTFDFLLEENRVLNTLLKKKGYKVQYKEYSAGHNYTAWRNALPEALSYLFGAN